MNSKVKSIIKKGMAATGTAGGLLGVTGGDTFIIAAAWGTMMYSIAKHHGVTLNEDTCIETSAGLLGSIASYKLGCTLLTWGVAGLIGAGTAGTMLIPAALGMNAILNALFTYRVGKLYDDLYGAEGMKTAAMTFGAHIINSVLAVPSPSEFRDFLHVWKG